MGKKLQIWNKSEDEDIKEILEARGKAWGFTYKRTVVTVESITGKFKAIHYKLYDKKGELATIVSSTNELRGFLSGLFYALNGNSSHVNTPREFLENWKVAGE